VSGGKGALPALLFDLDGTLTDPFVGISRCIAFAMERLDRPCPPVADLRWCIGPPLRSIFARLLDTQDAALIDAGVFHYRDRYASVGKFENTLVSGIKDTLELLSSQGLRMAVATSKLETFAVDIIGHFDLAAHFEAVHGSRPDGANADKTALLDHILRQMTLDATRTIMIGDRSHDVIGPKANGVACVGVLWGYGDRAELEGAGAAAIAAAPAELPGLIESLLAPA
jgi:phosphoglycolate phosphatase